MFAKRLAPSAMLAALTLAAAGSFNSPSGEAADASQSRAAGRSYGASQAGGEREAWLRLGVRRRSVASVYADFDAPASQCTGGQPGYSSYFVGGHEWGTGMAVRADGTFSGRDEGTYPLEGGRRVREQLRVTGQLTSTGATLAVQGTMTFTGGGRPEARCTFGPQRWQLSD